MTESQENEYLDNERISEKELEKQYQTEGTLLFGRMKRFFEDETLKRNRILNQEIEACFS